MTLDERLSLLWKTLQKLTPEEIDKELDGAGAPLKERTALFSTEIISNPIEMLIKDFKPEENKIVRKIKFTEHRKNMETVIVHFILFFIISMISYKLGQKHKG